MPKLLKEFLEKDCDIVCSFIKNKNLNGENVDRAIRDFEGIIKFIEEDHAIAHYCLTKAYSYKGQNKMAKKHANKISKD